MKNIRHYLALAALAATCSISAQNLNSAYFMDGYAYGHLMNPAKDYDRNSYFSVPFLPGNMNLGIKGNIGLKNVFLKNPNGNGLVTYMHPDISYAKAMEGFNKNNKLMSDTRYDLLSVGFHGMGGYNTITMGVRANVGLNVPYELFSLTKKLENRDYEIEDVDVNARAWAEIGLGHSRQINEAWRIGAKAKVLLGVGYANLKVDELELDLQNHNRWVAEGDATMEMGVNGFTWGETETKEYKTKPGTYEQLDLGNADVDKFGLNGGGFAVDLGAEWDLGKQGLLDGMKISAAVLDLGFIKWKNVSMAYNKGNEFVFDGFENIQVEDGPGTSFDDQIDELEDKLSDLISLQDGGVTSKSRSLGATLNVGVEYALPVYDKLSFGLLSTTRFQGVYTWNEERISANISPVKWFELGANVGVGTMGASFGWMINLHPRGFNLFMGMDRMLGKISKQGIPLRSNADFNIGINFPLGKSKI